jgi:hypothetical protein
MMRLVRFALLVLLGVLLAVVPVAADCTKTPNLGLCKGARGQLEWDTFLNANFDIIDSALLNTGASAQTKSGVLTLGGLKLALSTQGSLLFVGVSQAVTQDNANLFWDNTAKRLGIGTSSPTVALDVSGTARVTGFRMPTGASAGYVLTTDGSGNGTWQAGGGGGTSGWTDGGTTVYLTVGTDRISLTGTSATEKLEVGGAIKVADASGSPTAGTIRWAGGHFQGYTGTAWVNLDEVAGSGGGWTDAGATITVTTPTDTLGIGAAADADAKMLLAPDANLSALKVSGFSLTGADASSLAELAGTWNTSGAPTALKLTVTDTASAAGSRLLDLIVGAASRFSVAKDGTATAVNLTASTLTTTPALKVTTGPVAGHVLTSDADGNATWQVSAGGSGVPTGLIALFDAACPSGWTSISGASGVLENRFPMGVASYTGTPAGASTHTHTVDVAITTSSSAGAHTHTVDPPNATSTSAGSHYHNPEVGSGSTGSSGGHDHGYSGTTTSAGDHGHSIGVVGSIQPGEAGSWYDIVATSTNNAGAHTHDFSGTVGAVANHSHDLSWPNTASGGTHTHDLNIGAFASGSDGAHTHTTDPASVTSGSGSSLPPYVGFVFCKKT